MKKNILITGGLGYVGGRLMKSLSDDYDVIISSRRDISLSKLQVPKNTSLVNHESLIKNKSFPKDVETVIHLAALNEIDCVKFPQQAVEVNINQTRELIQAAIANGVTRFIYFSTIHVYGHVENGAVVTEESLTRPIHPYSITHRAAEDYVNQAHDTGLINGIIVRLSNSFGAPLFPSVNRWSLLVNDICKQAVTKSEIKLMSNGCQYRDFITLSDVVAATRFLVATERIQSPNIFNLSSEVSTTVFEMANRVANCYEEMFGTSIPVLVPPDSQLTREAFYTIKSNNFSLLGVKPQNNFQQELLELLQFCKLHFGRA
ncbi:MAG: NAD-dependent epimerase/dehydratase family protein [Flammeovirgaceae bacterium]